MRTILEIYFGVNLFMGGFYLGDDWDRDILMTVIFILFGVPLAIAQGLKWCFNPVVKWLDSNTAIVLLFNVYILRKFRKMKPEALENINYRLNNGEFQNDAHKKRWSYAVGLINKLNNYTPSN